MTSQDERHLANGANRRNKVATYGRGSQKPDPIHSIFSPQIVLDGSEDAPTVVPKKTTSRLRTYGAVAQVGLHKKVDQRISPVRIVVPESKSLFDLPSSESEDDQFSRSRGSSKKRRLEAWATNTVEDGVYDDESLQRHVAAEAQRDQENLQTFSHPKQITKPRASNWVAQKTTAHDSAIATGAHKAKPKGTLESRATLKKTILPTKPIVTQSSKNQQKLPVKKSIQDPSPICLPFSYSSKAVEVLPVPLTPLLHTASLTRKVPAAHGKLPVVEENIALKLPSPSRTLQSLQSSLNQVPPNKKHSRATIATRSRSHTPDTAVASIRENTPPTSRAKPQRIDDSVQLDSPSTIGVQGLQLTSPKGPTTTKERKYPNALHASIEKLEVTLDSSRPRKRIIDRLYRHSSCSSTDSSGTKEGNTSSDAESPNASFSASTSVQVLFNDVAVERPALDDVAVEDDQDTQQTSKSSQSTYGGAKVTYQHQRSYLTEEMVDEVDLLKIPILPDPILERSSRRSRTTKKVPGLPGLPSLQSSFEIGEDLDDTTTGPTRNIHELRQAGGNARLLGSMEAILDDIDLNKCVSLSTRRTGLLDLCRSISQPSLCQAFIDHGLVDQLFAQFDKSLDEVTGVLVMSCFGFVLNQQCPIHLLSLINQSSVFEFLGSRLDNTEDFKAVVGKRRSNLSRIMQQDVLDLVASLLASPIWTDQTPPCLTARTLSLHCLEVAVRHLREAGCTANVLSEHLVSSLVEIAVPAAYISKTSSELASYIGSFDFCQAISILEYTTTISQTIETHETAWTTDSIEQTSHLLSMLCNQTHSKLGKAQLLILRLCLNLTNRGGSACEIFCKSETVRAAIAIALNGFSGLYQEEDAGSHAILLDNVVLAIGFLINLAESSNAARLQFMSADQGDTTSLDTLLQVFNANVARASEVSTLPYHLQ